MNEKDTLLSRITTAKFILDETALFLDTHPDCQRALDFYKKYLDIYKEAVAEYSEKYGMLSHDGYMGQSSWQWTEGPWPWEYKEG